jgi:hypothetical protein
VAGIAFAFAINLLLVSLVFVFFSSGWQIASDLLVGIALVVALFAGILTTWYVGPRSGIHAFIGGLLSVPVLGIFVIPGNWGIALLAGSFCAAGGILGEFFLRRRRS